MRAWIPLALAAILCRPSSADAMTLKVGLGHVTGTYHYAVTDLNTKGAPQTNADDDINVTVVTLEAESLTPITDNISAGFAVGASTAGEYSFDLAKMINPAAGTPNQNDGDTYKADLTRMPVLLKVAGAIPAGPGEARLGLGAGAVVFAWQTTTVDQLWSNAVGGVSVNHDLTHVTEAGTQTTYATGTVTLFDIEIAPGYHYRLSKRDLIGLELPLSIVGKKDVTGTITNLTTAPAAGSNPLNSPSVAEMGGFTWGLQLAWTHAL